MFNSEDGGEHWHTILDQEGQPSGQLLAVDERDSQRVYVAGWGYVGESRDGGSSWSGDQGPLCDSVPREESRLAR